MGLQMSDELNRRVSELIEPRPAQPLTIHSTVLLSPLKAWTWEFEAAWQHREWDTDASANEMLLEMMPRVTLAHYPQANEL